MNQETKSESSPDKEKQKRLLIEIMKEDEKNGMYESGVPYNYAQRAIRDESGKVIGFEPFDKERLRGALKEVKAKKIRDSYRSDPETMSFRAVKESTPSSESEKEESQEELINDLIDHTFGATLTGRKAIKEKFTITRKP